MNLDPDARIYIECLCSRIEHKIRREQERQERRDWRRAYAVAYGALALVIAAYLVRLAL